MKSSGPEESITTNKASGGNGTPVELFQILKDDADLTAKYVGRMVPMLMIIILLARMQWREKGSGIF